MCACLRQIIENWEFAVVHFLLVSAMNGNLQFTCRQPSTRTSTWSDYPLRSYPYHHHFHLFTSQFHPRFDDTLTCYSLFEFNARAFVGAQVKVGYLPVQSIFIRLDLDRSHIEILILFESNRIE